MSDKEQAQREPNGQKDEESGAAGGAARQSAGGDSDETLKMSAKEMVARRSRWQSSLAAMRYVSSISQDEGVQVRDTDRFTSLALLIICMFALCAMLPLPYFAWLYSMRLGLVLLVDFLIGFVLLLYTANRLGILTTLTPRQAILSWQLMLAASLIGIYMAVNLAVIIALVLANTPPIVIPR